MKKREPSTVAATTHRARSIDARLAQAVKAAASMRRRLLARDESIAAKERQRMSRDMHDGLGQDLFALKLELAHLHAHTGNADPRLQASAAQALRLVDDLIANLRAIIDDLRPAALELGLDAAIRSQVDTCRRRFGNACSYELKLEPVELEPEAATALFRILQEALNNIHKHARASRVRVQLTQRKATVVMSVRDNGCGFLPAQPARHDAFGLIGMRERVGALDGKLEIASGSGRGTLLTIAIPLEARGLAGDPPYFRGREATTSAVRPKPARPARRPAG